MRTNVRNSSRVFESSRKPPNMAEVTVLALIFCTPLITLHMCLSRKKEISYIIRDVKHQSGRRFRFKLRRFDHDANSVRFYGLADSLRYLFR